MTKPTLERKGFSRWLDTRLARRIRVYNNSKGTILCERLNIVVRLRKERT
jgi:hypothetical protein